MVATHRRSVVRVTNATGLVAAVKDDSVGTIVVAAGTYNLTSMSGVACGKRSEFGDSALCIGRNLTIRAETNETVLLNAMKQSWRVVYVDEAVRVELVGLSITGGKADEGGGLFIYGSATLKSCTISGNEASYGGGLFISGETTLTSCSVVGNEAPSTDGSGGGLCIDNGGRATLTSCTISGNGPAGLWLDSGRAFGGGGLFIHFGGQAHLRECLISGNRANLGGGLHVDGIAIMISCRISGHREAHTSYGGGLFIYGSATLTSCTISDNVATNAGGGLYVNVGGEATLTASSISGNEVTVVDMEDDMEDSVWGGGGLNIAGGATATLIECTISGNVARLGGGIFNHGGTLTLISCGVKANKATGSSGAGGGIYADTTMDTSWSSITPGITILLNGSVVASNNAPTGSNFYIPSTTARVTYVLPTPPGTYLDHDFVCHWLGHPAKVQICNSSRYSGTSLVNLSTIVDEDVPYRCPLGHYCDGAHRKLCPPGTLGNTTGLNSSECAGRCPERSYCGKGSVAAVPCADGTFGNGTGLVDQTDCSTCLPGFWCVSGGLFECGGASVFCLGNNAGPVQVQEGFYSYSSRKDEPDLDNEINRTKEAACPSGQWCAGGRRYPCSTGTFSLLPGQTHADACTQCPFNTTTFATGASDPSFCICQPDFFDDLGRDPTNATGATGARTCASCPPGFECFDAAATTHNVTVAAGFWRPSINASRAKPCPISGTCAGGKHGQLCASGFQDIYCTGCAELGNYLNTLKVECRSCLDEQAMLATWLLGVLGILMGVLMLVCSFRQVKRHCSRRQPLLLQEPLQLQGQPLQLQGPSIELVSRVAPANGALARLNAAAETIRPKASQIILRLKAAAETVGLRSKLKIGLGFYLILAQIEDVYQIRYPPDYQSISSVVFAPLRRDLLAWLPGLHLGCLGAKSIAAKLVVYLSFPAAVVVLALVTSYAASLCGHAPGRHPLLPALPFVLFWTSFVFPSVSSIGFQAISTCDCFDELEGGSIIQRCFLPADYSYECPTEHAGPEVLILGTTAIVIYGIGVPALFARLLYMARDGIRAHKEGLRAGSQSGHLVAALSFLHGNLISDALWWPLVDASRTLVLVGTLALIVPGEPIQILCGVMVALFYMVLQIWTSPYCTRSDNLLALGAGLALVLNLLSSLGLQLNAVTEKTFFSPIVLSIILYVAGMSIFGSTTVIFCVALQKQLSRPKALLIYHCSPSVAPLPSVRPEAVEVEKTYGDSAVVFSGTSELLREKLLVERPARFLFAGHADAQLDPGKRTLAFADDTGRLELVRPDTLVDMFLSLHERRGDLLEFVFLNGCESDDLGHALREQAKVPWVVCWRTKCHDEAARLFSVYFFEALGRASVFEAEPYPSAFYQAKSALITKHTRAGASAGGTTAQVPLFVFRSIQARLPTPSDMRGDLVLDALPDSPSSSTWTEDGQEPAAQAEQPVDRMSATSFAIEVGVPLLLCPNGDILGGEDPP